MHIAIIRQVITVTEIKRLVPNKSLHFRITEHFRVRVVNSLACSGRAEPTARESLFGFCIEHCSATNRKVIM